MAKVDGDCYRCGKFHPMCSPCHQSPEDAALDREQVLDAERDPYLDLSIVFQEADGALVDAFYFLGTLTIAIAHGKETAEAYGCPRFLIHPHGDPENALYRHPEATVPGEHRGSRPLDADFREAAAKGFAPMTPSEKEAFREKLVDMGAVIHGRRTT
jgi:hypothetical protein